MNQKRVFFWLRLLISIILILWVSTKTDFGMLVELFSSVRLHFYLIAFLLTVVERVLLAYKWNLLLTAKKMRLPFLKIFKIIYLTSFVGTFLPSSVGGDIARIYSLYKYNGNPVESFSSVVVERMIALFSSLTLALACALLFSRIIVNQNILLVILIMFGGLVVSIIVLLKESLMQIVFKALDIVKACNLKQRVQKLCNSFTEYANYRGVLLYVLSLSYLFQLARVLVTYFVYLSIGQGVHILYFFVFVPVVIILTMLPLSVGGIGIREGAFVYLFSQVGMATSEAFTLSILVYFLSVISIVPGAVIYILEGITSRQSLARVENRR